MQARNDTSRFGRTAGRWMSAITLLLLAGCRGCDREDDPVGPPANPTLTVSAAGSGSGVVSSVGIACTITNGTAAGDCSESHPSGAVVVLTQSAAAGNVFGGWGDACTGSNDCQVTLSTSRTVTAGFAAVPTFALTIAATGAGAGTITATGITCSASNGTVTGDCTESFPAGTLVEVIASPAAGHTFGGWSGACAGTSACLVSMSQPRALTASFSPPGASVPGSPSNLVVRASTTNTALTLTWTRNSTNETGFRIERCAGVQCGATAANFTQIAQLGAGVTSYVDNTSAGTTAYSYRVRAFNGAGNSGYTSVAAPLIRIVNQMPTSLWIHEVVRLKLAVDLSGFGTADLLTHDNAAACQPLPGPSIDPGEAQSFVPALGTNYALFIQIGHWEVTGPPFCGSWASAWSRTLTFLETNGTYHTVYVPIVMTEHNGGTIDIVISGSYLNGTLRAQIRIGTTVVGTFDFIIGTL